MRLKITLENLPDYDGAHRLIKAHLSPEIVAHSIRVMELRQWDRLGLGDDWSTDNIAALLHDVVEDSDVTLDDIGSLFGSEVRRVVDLLTRRDGATYFDYIARVATDDMATGIKLADLQDHFAQSDTLSDSLRQRYEKAREILAPATGEHY
jgi:(p)ppGpp synthase/HD superfamily hydrolase